MITAKEARKLADSKENIDEYIDDVFTYIKTNALYGHTTLIMPVPKHRLILKELKKELTKNGFKYSIKKDNSLLIKW